MKIIRPESSIEKEIISFYKEGLSTTVLSKTSPERVLFLRPSQMPFCPISFFIRHATHGLHTNFDLPGSFYTSLGTVVHQIVQSHLCKSGKLLANYYCFECKTSHPLSYKYECCDFPTRYEEIKINYKGIVGNIDGIFRTKNKKLWLADFKTTSISGSKTKKANPGVAYREQLETYSYCFEKQYKTEIEGILNLFIPRDNINSPPVIWHTRLTDILRDKIGKRLKEYRKLHQEVLDISTLKDALTLADYGFCNNPYCKVCSISDITTHKAKKLLKQAFEIGQSKNHLPIRSLAQRNCK
jgi:hypothetical protein